MVYPAFFEAARLNERAQQRAGGTDPQLQRTSRECRGIAGRGLLARAHLPLYRQSMINAREGDYLD